MGNVYAKAVCVHIWLPCDDTWSHLTPTKLQSMLSRYHVQSWEYAQKLRYDADIMREVRHIATSPWFSRVWTLLEFTFAQETLIYCGPSIPLPGIKLMEMSQDLTPSPFHKNLPCHLARRQLLTDFTYINPDLIFAVRKLQATLAVDKVYSLYPILSARLGWEPPRPDYSKAASEVFREMAITLLRSQGPRILLGVPGVHGSRSCRSWVPDLAVPGRRPMDRYIRTRDIKLSDDEQALLLQGTVVDEVFTIAKHYLSSERAFFPPPDQFNLTLQEEENILMILLMWYQTATAIHNPSSHLSAEFFQTASQEYSHRLAKLFLHLVEPKAPDHNSTTSKQSMLGNRFIKQDAHDPGLTALIQ